MACGPFLDNNWVSLQGQRFPSIVCVVGRSMPRIVQIRYRSMSLLGEYKSSLDLSWCFVILEV